MIGGVKRVAVRAGIALLISTSCSRTTPEKTLPEWALRGRQYMVAADHPLASEAGARILAEGGNAFDAAVAVSFALGVVRPYSTGIGGGGFAMLRPASGAPKVVDFRETAPAACVPDAYLDSSGSPIEDLTTRGVWAVGVPGTLRAAEHVLEKYGTLSLADVLQPAIELAEAGFPVDAHTHKAMTVTAKRFREHPEYSSRFAELAVSFLVAGEPYEIGDTLRRPRLAATLRRIASEGAAALYTPEGFLHATLIQYMMDHRGPMTSADLTEYQLRDRQPLSGTFGEYETWTLPPPSSGGAVITEVLNSVACYDALDLDDSVAHAAWPHFLVECFKHAFADRAEGLGDWDHDTTLTVLRTITRMIDPESARRTAELFDPDTTFKPKDYGSAWLADDAGTSHFCVVDARGNAVSWSETVNLEFGSYVMIPGTGVVLNDEMDDFSIEAGIPNEFGLIQSDANLIGPGKRPLSSMSPTMVTRQGELIFLAGGSGGPRIITATLHVILNALVFGMRVDEAVAAPRFHHQWQPDVVRIQPDLDAQVIHGLLERGHAVAYYAGSAGVVQAIDCRNAEFFAACDPYKGGRPAGR